MRFTIRAILAGILIGAAFYFVPFGFPFFFLILLIFIFSRFFFGWRRWHGGYWRGYGYGPGCGYPYPGSHYEEEDITPIDGFGGRPSGGSSATRKIIIE